MGSSVSESAPGTRKEARQEAAREEEELTFKELEPPYEEPLILPIYAEDIARAVDFADRKLAARKKSGRFDPWRTTHAINVQGAIAEIVLLRYFGVEWIGEVYRGGDPGHDLILSGFCIEIKSTHYDNGRLLVGPIALKDHVDILALVVVDRKANECVAVGWVYRSRWDNEHGVGDCGKGPRDFMNPNRLSKIEDLSGLLESCERIAR